MKHTNGRAKKVGFVMKRIKIVGLVLLAILAISATATAPGTPATRTETRKLALIFALTAAAGSSCQLDISQHKQKRNREVNKPMFDPLSSEFTCNDIINKKAPNERKILFENRLLFENKILFEYWSLFENGIAFERFPLRENLLHGGKRLNRTKGTKHGTRLRRDCEEGAIC
jgi:hypothetical protein